MENLEEMLVPVELKYCERCGGLWFRSKNQEEEVYCPGCVPKMAEFPPARRRKRVIVVRVDSVDEIQACLAELSGVCMEGGNA